MNISQKNIFFNRCFDKSRLKALILWSILNCSEEKTIELVEQLKNIGFQQATLAGISLGIEDLQIPLSKVNLIAEAELDAQKTLFEDLRGNLTAVEKFQRLIDTWHLTSETLKSDVIKSFREIDILNPVYMMAFSGARGNVSQVRQLVGMRGLMADPQGQIINFPIQSNFREGLTLTEYIISCYGARKGVVDTALRTATSGYLTRRLVDVAQHVMVYQFDCQTNRGIVLTNIKMGTQVAVSLQKRLIGRVSAESLMFQENISSNLKSGLTQSTTTLLEPNLDKSSNTELSKESKKSFLISRNVEISATLAEKISKIKKQVLVRSALTCQAKHGVCQLCYGWSLSHGNLVALGEAVGVIAAQSIGEPGTQLTMRTFHTGGVFSGDVMKQINSPETGWVVFPKTLNGTLIRTTHGKIAFLTYDPAEVFIQSNIDKAIEGVKSSDSLLTTKQTKITLPIYTILYIRNGQKVEKNEFIAEYSSLGPDNQSIKSTQEVNADITGEVFFENVYLKISTGLDGKKNFCTFKFSDIWLLSCENVPTQENLNELITKSGDLITQNSTMGQANLFKIINNKGSNIISNKTAPELLSSRAIRNIPTFLFIKTKVSNKYFDKTSVLKKYLNINYFLLFTSYSRFIKNTLSYKTKVNFDFKNILVQSSDNAIYWYPKSLNIINLDINKQNSNFNDHRIKIINYLPIKIHNLKSSLSPLALLNFFDFKTGVLKLSSKKLVALKNAYNLDTFINKKQIIKNLFYLKFKNNIDLNNGTSQFSEKLKIQLVNQLQPNKRLYKNYEKRLGGNIFYYKLKNVKNSYKILIKDNNLSNIKNGYKFIEFNISDSFIFITKNKMSSNLTKIKTHEVLKGQIALDIVTSPSKFQQVNLNQNKQKNSIFVGINKPQNWPYFESIPKSILSKSGLNHNSDTKFYSCKNLSTVNCASDLTNKLTPQSNLNINSNYFKTNTLDQSKDNTNYKKNLSSYCSSLKFVKFNLFNKNSGLENTTNLTKNKKIVAFSLIKLLNQTKTLLNKESISKFENSEILKLNKDKQEPTNISQFLCNINTNLNCNVNPIVVTHNSRCKLKLKNFAYYKEDFNLLTEKEEQVIKLKNEFKLNLKKPSSFIKLYKTKVVSSGFNYKLKQLTNYFNNQANLKLIGKQIASCALSSNIFSNHKTNINNFNFIENLQARFIPIGQQCNYLATINTKKSFYHYNKENYKKHLLRNLANSSFKRYKDVEHKVLTKSSQNFEFSSSNNKIINLIKFKKITPLFIGSKFLLKNNKLYKLLQTNVLPELILKNHYKWEISDLISKHYLLGFNALKNSKNINIKNSLSKFKLTKKPYLNKLKHQIIDLAGLKTVDYSFKTLIIKNIITQNQSFTLRKLYKVYPPDKIKNNTLKETLTKSKHYSLINSYFYKLNNIDDILTSNLKVSYYITSCKISLKNKPLKLNSGIHTYTDRDVQNTSDLLTTNYPIYKNFIFNYRGTVGEFLLSSNSNFKSSPTKNLNVESKTSTLVRNSFKNFDLTVRQNKFNSLDSFKSQQSLRNNLSNQATILKNIYQNEPHSTNVYPEGSTEYIQPEDFKNKFISFSNSLIKSFSGAENSTEELIINTSKNPQDIIQNSLIKQYLFNNPTSVIKKFETQTFSKQDSLKSISENSQIRLLSSTNQKTYIIDNKKPLVKVGDFIRYGSEIAPNLTVPESGLVIKISKSVIINKVLKQTGYQFLVTVRLGKPVLVSSGAVFNVKHGDFIEKNTPLVTLPYTRLKTGDIVQGIPKIEELFEARRSGTLHKQLKMIYESYKYKLNSRYAARKSLERIQQIIVENVLTVYQSQGVSISDKHVEIIVRQMTSKVRILKSGRSGLLRGEIVKLESVENANKLIYGQKADYEPILIGITKAALDIDKSFISAASFQETTRILSRAAIERKTDFLRGLKENVILGQLVPAGTGFSIGLEAEDSNHSDKIIELVNRYLCLVSP
uniref:DNA-directed RNA polymerase subunit beta'' n=1 Tax=Neodangemannia microcystis TaxID=173495 RepID=A0A1W6EH91_9CHLO|nr:beta'' subunit of RNA polymerase [Neodangemannia microcystis]ARK14784.1 beta'' subunit of RNA polymerase [Neodangemannia microcystis]